MGTTVRLELLNSFIAWTVCRWRASVPRITWLLNGLWAEITINAQSEIKIYWCCANLKFIVMLKINVGINFDWWTVEVGKDAEAAKQPGLRLWEGRGSTEYLSIAKQTPVNNDPHKTRIISSHRPIRNNYYWIKYSFCLLKTFLIK